MARIGDPVARAAGVHELTSFDDQSDDAGWFLYREAFMLEALTSPRDLWRMLALVNPATRELSQYTEDADGLIERPRLRNAGLRWVDPRVYLQPGAFARCVHARARVTLRRSGPRAVA